MSNTSGLGDFGKWVPGFEFLQSLTRAGAPAAGPSGWVAPTLSVEEIDKRVQELKAVLFWLEQNSAALKATIQALEVQKMTLSALKGMNVSLQDMAQAFSVKPAATGAADATAPAAAPKQAATGASKAAARKPRPRARAAGQAAAPAAAAVDPMQWWGALTQQFAQIAGAAMADAQAAAKTGGKGGNQAGAQTAPPSGAATAPPSRRATARKPSVRAAR